MSVPSRSAFAAITRYTVEEHREWDSPHSFLTLRWDGDSLSCRTWVCIMPDVDPVKYPAVMMGAVREELEKYPDDPAYGYLLQGEFFGTQEPDAAEACIAWAVDIHGRLWSAAKTRTNPDRIQEAFYQPGRAPRGQMIQGLLTVAYATGVIGHGMPGPQGPLN